MSQNPRVDVPKPRSQTSPTFEPLTLPEIKARLDLAAALTLHDDKLNAFIALARETLEKDTGYVIATRDFLWTPLAWPVQDTMRLPIFNTTAIVSVVYVDEEGISQEWDSANYYLSGQHVWPLLAKSNVHENWPYLSEQVNPIEITFTAGFAAQGDVSPWIREACASMVAAQWYAGKDAARADSYLRNYLYHVKRRKPGYAGSSPQ